MVGHLLGDGDVQALGDLVDQPQHVVVRPAHLGSEWSSLIGPDPSRYCPLIGGQLTKC